MSLASATTAHRVNGDTFIIVSLLCSPLTELSEDTSQPQTPSKHDCKEFKSREPTVTPTQADVSDDVNGKIKQGLREAAGELPRKHDSSFKSVLTSVQRRWDLNYSTESILFGRGSPSWQVIMVLLS